MENGWLSADDVIWEHACLIGGVLRVAELAVADLLAHKCVLVGSDGLVILAPQTSWVVGSAFQHEIARLVHERPRGLLDLSSALVRSRDLRRIEAQLLDRKEVRVSRLALFLPPTARYIILPSGTKRVYSLLDEHIDETGAREVAYSGVNAIPDEHLMTRLQRGMLLPEEYTAA